MTGDPPTSAPIDSASTEEALVQATHRALREHGYSDLAVTDIAAEFDKSKSLIYYHYDSKDDLLLELLTYATDQLFENIDSNTGQGHHNDLNCLLTLLLPQSLSAERHDAQQILFELRARALVFSILSLWAFRLPIAYVLVAWAGMDATGVWHGIAAPNGLALLAVAAWYYRGTWTPEVIEPETATPAD